jgi:predicted choloylglycine hydrolase
MYKQIKFEENNLVLNAFYNQEVIYLQIESFSFKYYLEPQSSFTNFVKANQATISRLLSNLTGLTYSPDYDKVYTFVYRSIKDLYTKLY